MERSQTPLMSQTAEYALRAMAHLARLPAGEAARANDISEATGIPPHYASKVLRRMVGEGLLVAQKGHGGGFRLARAPGRIRVLDVLEAVDASIDETRCAFGWSRCSKTHPCPVHPMFSQLKQAILGWARRTTLEDVRSGGTDAISLRPSERGSG